MPRSKPSRVEEVRITLGTKERMMMEDLLTSYRISSVCGNDSIVETFGDFGKVLAVAGTVGGLLELLGITDVFDFDDEVRALVLPTKETLRQKAAEGPLPIAGPLADVLRKYLRGGF